MSIPELTFEQVVSRLKSVPVPARARFLAMYSSWFGGIVREPELMLLPIDDHMVHRGDGVFEGIKCVDGKIYCLDRHLERLARSASLVSLEGPAQETLKQICVETVRAAGAADCMMRLYLSRGPGSFTPNPYDTLGAQVYLIVTMYRGADKEKYEKGVTAKLSKMAVKEGLFANVKSCNYLQNVLMKKEAVDAGVDYTISHDEQGFLAEGSTENFAIVSARGELLVPGFERTLKGVTAVRAMELASQKLLARGLVTSVRNAQIRAGDVEQAREVMMLGTTLDCLPVTTFEAKKVGGDGKVGPVCRALLEVLSEDLKTGPFLTPV
jgi:branched-subunit amino acid aminotransferase/4-amino-4-deoxychorismate lyase